MEVGTPTPHLGKARFECPPGPARPVSKGAVVPPLVPPRLVAAGEQPQALQLHPGVLSSDRDTDLASELRLDDAARLLGRARAHADPVFRRALGRGLGDEGLDVVGSLPVL